MKSVKIVPNINSETLVMFILYDCVLPHTQDSRPRPCPAALEKTQSENREGFFIIPYHHNVTGRFGSSDVLLDGRSTQICMFLVLQLTHAATIL